MSCFIKLIKIKQFLFACAWHRRIVKVRQGNMYDVAFDDTTHGDVEEHMDRAFIRLPKEMSCSDQRSMAVCPVTFPIKATLGAVTEIGLWMHLLQKNPSFSLTIW